MYIYVVIVVYNKHCCDINICKFFENMSDKNIIPVVYDNSTINQKNAEYCKSKGIVYLGGVGNIGLTKASNRAIDFCRANNKDAYICFFNDDANLKAGYFVSLRKSIAAHPESSVFFPILLCQGKIISPAILTKLKTTQLFSRINEAKNCKNNYITVIFSSMAVKLELFMDYRFDETIFMDGIDHSFMEYVQDNKIAYAVMDYQCEHELSSFMHPSKESAVNRYRIFCNDMENYLRSRKLIYFFTVLKRMVRLSIEYRTRDFAKILLNQHNSKMK